MAQSWRVRKGLKVRYRTAGNKVKHAIVTVVTNQTTVNLRVGNGATKLTVVGAALVAPHIRNAAGWYRER